MIVIKVLRSELSSVKPKPWQGAVWLLIILGMLTWTRSGSAEVFINYDGGSSSSIYGSQYALSPTIETISKNATSTTVRITIENLTPRWYYVELMATGSGVLSSGLPSHIYMAPKSNDNVLNATFNAGDTLSLIADGSSNHPSILGLWGLDALCRLSTGSSIPLDSFDIALLIAGINNPVIDLGKAVYDKDLEAALGAINDLVNDPAYAGIKAQIERKLGEKLTIPSWISLAWNFGSYCILVADTLIYPDAAYLNVYGEALHGTSGGATVSWLTGPPASMTAGIDYRVAWQISGGSIVSATDARWDVLDPKDAAHCSNNSNPVCMTTNKSSGGLPGTYSSLVRAPNVGARATYKYVTHAVVDGIQVWSPILNVIVSPPPSPTINSVTPSLLSGMPLPQRQLLRILGTGFTDSTTLTFSTGQNSFPNRIPDYVSPTELQYRIAVGNISANWTARAVNDVASSNLYPFRVMATADTVAPTISITSPVRTSETYTTAATSIALSGIAADDVGLAGLTWFNSRGGSGSIVMGQTWTVSAVPIQSGTNIITVQATDQAGNTSSASITIQVSNTSNSRPGAPTLYDIVVTNGGYTVSWSLISGATYYLEEDLGGTFASPTRFATGSTSISFSAKSSGTYYYRVIAVNAAGSGPASAVKSATVMYNQGPGLISATNPVDGSAGQPLSVTLSWTAANPGGEGMRFNVYFVPADTDNFFQNNIVSRNQIGTSFALSNLPYNTRVSWGIQAIDDIGNVRYSQMFHFSTIAYTVQPTGSISINAGAATTTSNSVTLNISVAPAPSRITQFMRFSNDGVTWSYWQNMSPIFAWNLADYNYGGIAGLSTYTVYAQFRDDQGNQSLVYSDSIAKVAGTPGNIILNGQLFQTIQDAINAANSGDTVYLSEGYYHIEGKVNPPRYPNRVVGIVMKPGVMLMGAGADRTTLDGNGDPVWVVIDADNAVIEGMTITNPMQGSSMRDSILLESNGSKVRHCILKGSYAGIMLGSFDGGTTIPSNNEISNNLIINNSDGIFIGAGSNIAIYNNTIAYNYPGGILQRGTSIEFSNNIVIGSSYGIGVSDTSSASFHNNDVYNNAENYQGVGDQTGINGNISSDPRLVNPSGGDYGLSSGSPCIDSGRNVGNLYQGSAPDIGAYEQNAVGSLQVNTNQAGASFTISGPLATFHGSGTSWNQGNLPIGIYTISFSQLPNLYSPSYLSIELLSGQSPIINANYLQDSIPPVGNISINREEYSTADSTVTIALDIEDAVSGMGLGAQMQFSNDGVTWSAPEPYTTWKANWNIVAGYGASNGFGMKTIYAMVSDALGNAATFADSILYVPNRRVLAVPGQYSTIQAAVNDARAGDVVQVAPGTFKEDVTLRDGVILQGSGYDKTVSDAGISHITTATNSQIEGMGGYIAINANAGPTIIQNNQFMTGLTQIVITGLDRKIIRNNTFYSSSGSVTGVLVSGWNGAGQVVLQNNSFVHLGTALWLDGAQPTTNVFSRNNIFASNRQAIIDANTNDNLHQHIYSSFNTYWANTNGNFGELDPYYKTANLYQLMEAGDMNADPQFTDVSKLYFHLLALSTSIDSGNPEAMYQDLDLSRNDRGVFGGPSAKVFAMPPVIDSSPISQMVAPGASVTFNTLASGGIPLAYQWQKNGADIPGAISPTLTIDNVNSFDVANYSVVVSNEAGSISSAIAYLSLTGNVSPSYSLTVSAVNGLITKNPDNEAYPEGSQVNLTATPNVGYEFAGWGGDIGGASFSLTITMNGDKSVVGTFAQINLLPNLSGIEPATGIQGTKISATITGTYLTGAIAVAFSGSGVSATIGNGGTASSLPITITIDPQAILGPRTISVTTSSGTSAPFNGGFRIISKPDVDFNNDMKADILWRNSSTGEVLAWYMNGAVQIGSASVGTVADKNWRIVGMADFNGDGKPDILWRNTATGKNYVWFMNGITQTGGAYLSPVPDVNWKIVGTADFNGDGKPDILWRNTATGDNYVWFMNGITQTGGAYLSAIPDVNWKIVGTGDFNWDGQPDILWRNTSTGENYVWFMNGITQTGGAFLPSVVDLNWTIVGTDDLNGDGQPDILWRNKSTGENCVWLMDGAAIMGNASLPTIADANWLISDVGSAAAQFAEKADFNGDGKEDILWRNTVTGENIVWFMNGTTDSGAVSLPVVSDVNWKIVGAADFNGDGKPDILWRNIATGENYVWFMNGITQTGGAFLSPIPDVNWKIVGTGDFNGDGKPDILWRNTSTGENYVWFMNGITQTGGAYLSPIPDVNWKIVGTADLNGDGKPDILWRNTSTGENCVWFMNGITVAGEAYLSRVADLNWTIAP